MKINNLASTETVVNTNSREQVENKDAVQQQEQGKVKNGTVKGADLNLLQDPIEEKKKKAMEDAMEFIKNQFKSDGQIDDILDECRDTIKTSKAAAEEASQQLGEIEEQKEALGEMYADKEDEEYKMRLSELNEEAAYWKKQYTDAHDIIGAATRGVKAIKLEALKHHGSRSDLTCEQDAHKLDGKKSRDIIAEQAGTSKDSVRRFIRLTELIPEILDMVDEKKISMTPAVELSYLKPEEQRNFLEAMDYTKKYKDETGTTHQFYPDDMVTLLPDGALGSTWYGTTPEERTLLGSGKADVAIVDTGIAVAVSVTIDPVNTKTTVSEIVLPSYERMDETFVIKVAGDTSTAALSDVPNEQDDLDSMTKDELLAYANAHNISGVSASMNKADILSAIKAAS